MFALFEVGRAHVVDQTIAASTPLPIPGAVRQRTNRPPAKTVRPLPRNGQFGLKAQPVSQMELAGSTGYF